MLKLTRLNRSVVAINPDHVSFVDVSPDTTICLVGGEKIIVRESLDELIDLVVAFRARVRGATLLVHGHDGEIDGESVAAVSRRFGRPSDPPRSARAREGL